MMWFHVLDTIPSTIRSELSKIFLTKGSCLLICYSKIYCRTGLIPFTGFQHQRCHATVLIGCWFKSLKLLCSSLTILWSLQDLQEQVCCPRSSFIGDPLRSGRLRRNENFKPLISQNAGCLNRLNPSVTLPNNPGCLRGCFHPTFKIFVSQRSSVKKLGKIYIICGHLM